MHTIRTRQIPRATYLLLLIAVAAAAQMRAAANDPPARKGVYYRASASEWTMLDPATLSDSQTRGMDRFIATYGITGLTVNLTFDGSNSPVQIEDRKPTFLVRGFVPADDTLIVQLAVKRDAREVQTSMMLAGVTNKEGFKQADIHRIVFTKIGEDLYRVTPQETLKPGEYLLVFSRVETAFNFGIPK
jgi:hypothetical protein